MAKPTPPADPRGKVVYFLWSNFPRFVLLGLIVLILFLMSTIKEQSRIVAANKAAETPNERPPVNVVTYIVSPGPISDRINLPGAVEPWTNLLLMAKINGSVTEVLVNEGDSVKKGDVLARIEDDDFRIAVDRAKAAYKLAQSEYLRDKSLYDKGVTPISALDTKLTRMETAKADYDNARLMLSRTIVTSPMNGVIRKMEAKVGLQLSVGDPVAEILEVDRMKAIIGIPESDVTAVQKLDRVDITIQALDNRVFTGKKHFLSPSPETTARLYNLELEIDNPDGSILAGMFVRADLVKSHVENGLAVPFYSVISRNDEKFVFVEENGVATRRNVSLGIMEGWKVQIIDGVKPGDKVLVEGHRDVENQQRINVVKTVSSTTGMTL
ncbi:efflux RND transporter periplasmic adaptor subunit [Desulforhopalus singaporensis]|uniref:Barrel-sandwich domain of CusB or HlyD membrane-fusion n=1 Tax=Desulforhopalus singaporensis TaxID=91360 RepID=A0A1H0NF85_9BACT|nr:efflux RND transporter periplasmic adaptor subunit [Desulforhopalus singaporensis]SDO91334.1 Barrel-sandwich domain of CusB or HlyD membrane-fusion [Desulforhopalus singaporensis]